LENLDVEGGKSFRDRRWTVRGRHKRGGLYLGLFREKNRKKRDIYNFKCGVEAGEKKGGAA